MPNQEEIRDAEVKAAPDLGPEEKETTLTIINDRDRLRIYSDIPTHIKWILSVEESNVEEVRRGDSGSIIGITATIPKGIIRLQSQARKSNRHSQMVSYGPLKG